MPKHGGDQGGRPTKLTPPTLRKLQLSIKNGNYAEVAAAAVGIDRTTFLDWRKLGARSKTDKPIPEGWEELEAWKTTDIKAKDDRIYRWFSITIDIAEAQFEEGQNLFIQSVCLNANDVRAAELASKRLENRFPLKYKAPQRIEATTTSRVTLDDVTQLDDEELDARLAAFEQREKLDPNDAN